MLEIVLVVLLIALSIPYFFPLNLRTRSDLPPGPPPRLFVGNRGQGPPKQPWKWFRELHQQYGDVVYIKLGATPVVILGSAQAAWDLLEKRSNIYSSRPRFIMGQELLSDGLRGLMAPQGNYWRRWRKCLHTAFTQKTSETYRPQQSLESKVLMRDLLHDPKRFRTHLERYAASVIVTVTYGRRVEDVETDWVVRDNAKSMETLTLVNIPGKYAVESFPVLKYIPTALASWKRYVLERREDDIKLYTRLVDEVREKMKAGTAPESFAKWILTNQKQLEMSDLELAYTLATPFGAGVETSSGSLASFFLACAAYGDRFIAKAQQELDSVVGRDRMPTFDDMPDLPYIRAIVSEVLRWRPIAVLGGTPHASTADDYYKGYYIPKGSTIIAPLWSIHLNEKDFPEPHLFKPERFLDGSLKDYPGPLSHSSFGWGRRICPGSHLASASVFINIARTLWAFNIEKAIGPDGKPIEVDIFAFTDGFNSQPQPFEVSIKVRSPQHAQIIEDDYAEAKEALSIYEVK